MSAALSKYRLRSKIGKGAFGEVYCAFDCETGRTVAVKILRLSQEEFKSIKKEVKLLRSLSHPNVVAFVDCLRVENSVFLVMELMEGGSLKALLDKGGLSEQLAAKFVRQVLRGLAFLHGLNIAHRDIKAANLLLDKDGSLKIGDFGVAKVLSEESQADSAKGTPYWMAPQVIQLGKQSISCDIWSLGCTLVELVTGKPPYAHLLQFPAMTRIVEDEKPPLPKMSESGLDFLNLCFRKEPTKRASALELLEHPWLRTQDALTKEFAGGRLSQGDSLLGEAYTLMLQGQFQLLEKRLVQILRLLQGEYSPLYQLQSFHRVMQVFWAKGEKPCLQHFINILALLLAERQAYVPLSASGLISKVLRLSHPSKCPAVRKAVVFFLHRMALGCPDLLLAAQPFGALADIMRYDLSSAKEEVLLGIQMLHSLCSLGSLARRCCVFGSLVKNDLSALVILVLSKLNDSERHSQKLLDVLMLAKDAEALEVGPSAFELLLKQLRKAAPHSQLQLKILKVVQAASVQEQCKQVLRGTEASELLRRVQDGLRQDKQRESEQPVQILQRLLEQRQPRGRRKD